MCEWEYVCFGSRERSSYLVYSFRFKPCSCFAVESNRRAVVVEAPLRSSATREDPPLCSPSLWWERALQQPRRLVILNPAKGYTQEVLLIAWNDATMQHTKLLHYTAFPGPHGEAVWRLSSRRAASIAQSPNDWPLTKTPLTHVLRLLDKTSCSHRPIHQATSAKAFSVPNASL